MHYTVYALPVCPFDVEALQIVQYKFDIIINNVVQWLSINFCSFLW